MKSGLGLVDQRLQIEEEVARRGWRLIEIVEDAGISGKKIKGRDAMQAALARLDRGEADVLVSAKLDRISRSVQDLGWILDRASKKGWADRA